MKTTNKVYQSEKVYPIETNVKLNLHVTKEFTIFNTDHNRSLIIELLSDYTTNKFERA